MNSKVFKPGLIAAGILLGSAGQANATDTLISELNGQVVYDQTTNLSWIATGYQPISLTGDQACQ